MFRQKYLSMFIVVVMFFVIASGGCGGGGSSNSGTSQNNEQNNPEGWDTDPDDNNNTPQEPDIPDEPNEPNEPDEPDVPNVPDEPDVPNEPDTPQEPDEPEAEYSISILQGKWTASIGTGTATDNGGTFDLRMVHVNAQFSNVRINGNNATAIASTSAEWDAYKNGVYVTTTYPDNNQEAIEIRHVSSNVWRYTYPDGKSTVTVNITSEITANVTEEGITSEGYRYTANYTVTKDDPDTPAMKYDLNRLQGTWSASGGGGTATGYGRSYELRLSSGSSVSVSNLQVNGDNMTGDLDGIIGWNVYWNGTRVRRIGLEYSKLEGYHLSGNTWRASNGQSTMTLTSQTTASFFTKEGNIEIDGYTYKYFMALTMTKY